MVYLTQLVYLNPGKERVFDAFEDVATRLIAKHGGQLLLRLRPSPDTFVAGTLDVPYEMHFVRFSSDEDLKRFSEDEERKKVLHLKDESVRASTLVRGTATSSQRYELEPIGWVESPLTDRSTAPRQGDEGSPDAWMAFDPRVAEGLRDLRVGSEVLVLTWLDRARREVLVVRPRNDPANRLHGVFDTRSPDRPNPIGLHRVQILAVEGTRIMVRNLEALDGTPIIDVKPVLDRHIER